MEKLSKELWEEIKSHQKLPLIGTNVPNEGNGFNDRLSFDIDRIWERSEDDFIEQSKFKTIYLRDLANRADPSLSKERKFTESIQIENCSDNFLNTLLLYIHPGHYRRDFSVITKEIGNWTKSLVHHGKVIIEIVNWYTNDTRQFYGFQLLPLDIDKCTVKRKNVILKGRNDQKLRKVIIPKSKCIIIEFPKELGGYKEFKNKTNKIKKLGKENLFNIDNPKKSLDYSRNWDKQFDKIVSDWGWLNHRENITDFLYAYQLLKFNNSALKCCYAAIEAFKTLVSIISSKLNENATFKISGFLEENFYTELIDKFSKDELSLKEVFNAHNKSVMLDYD